MRDVKDGTHFVTTIFMIVLAISEMIAIIVVTLITINAMNSNDIVGGIEALMYWFVNFIILQVIIWPFVLIVDGLHKWSSRQ